jgi:hypothetical protein
MQINSSPQPVPANSYGGNVTPTPIATTQPSSGAAKPTEAVASTETASAVQQTGTNDQASSVPASAGGEISPLGQNYDEVV